MSAFTDTWPEADFPIAGPDPLMPFFLADVAGLGKAFTEAGLVPRSTAQKRGTRIPSPLRRRPAIYEEAALT